MAAGVLAYLLVGLGGAVGAVARFGVGRALAGAGGWPWGTFVVNVAGGLAMGLLAGWLAGRGGAEGWRLVLGTGLLGGFTTFSAFSLELVELLERGAWGLALLYALASVVMATAAVWAGLAAVRAFP